MSDVILVWLNDTLYTSRTSITGALPKGFRTDDSILFSKDFRRSGYDQCFVNNKLRDMVNDIRNDKDWQAYANRRQLVLSPDQMMFFPYFVHLYNTKQIGKWRDGILVSTHLTYPLAGNPHSNFQLSVTMDHTIPIMLHMPASAWLMAVLNFPPHAFANTIIIPGHKFPKYMSEIVPLTQRYRQLSQWIAESNNRYNKQHKDGTFKFTPGALFTWRLDDHFGKFLVDKNINLQASNLFTSDFHDLTQKFYHQRVVGNKRRLQAISNIFSNFFKTLGD